MHHCNYIERISHVLQMSDQDSSASASQTGEFEGDLDEDTNGDTNSEVEVDRSYKHSETHASSLSSFSSLRAVLRIKQKYHAMKKRRQDLAMGHIETGTQIGAPVRTSPKIFTFDRLTPSAFPALETSAQKKKKRRKKRVLYPNSGGRRVTPKKEHSRAKHCLYLLFAIVFIQVK